VGYLRFFWRQLTSMRTALFLLLLLAFAAVPGSLVPQKSADPNGVVQFEREHPTLFPILDTLQLFTTYSSVWFSAIYLLLFVSLIGCVIPRARHHYIALRSRPPRTPARLERLSGFTSVDVQTDAASELERAERVLRRAGYRVQRFPDSVSAERGYLRETGNLVFHLALVGILVAIAAGGSWGFTGQSLVVEGESFVNTGQDYDSFSGGRLVDEDGLEPYRVALDRFDVVYETENPHALGQANDYTAHVTVTDADGSVSERTIKVNHPLDVGGTQVFLLGNGYAPHLKVTSPDGVVVFDGTVPFLPQDTFLTSTGVVKIADGLSEQVGMQGFFYPTAAELATGAFASAAPQLGNPLLTLRVFSGDLGLDDGVPRSIYELDTTGLAALAGGTADSPALELALGAPTALPGGLGTIELTGVDEYISLDIHHDPSQGWVLVFAVLVVGGLLTGLFIPRRRVWVKAVATDRGTRLEYAGLARGEDPTLEAAITDIVRRHAAARDLG
jgi:cytochrome c biogenesis protein